MQFLIINKDNASLSSYWLILHISIVHKDGILATILAVVVRIGMDLLLITTNHNFFVLKTNDSLCYQMLK